MDDNAVHLDDQTLPFWVKVTEDSTAKDARSTSSKSRSRDLATCSA